MRTAIDLFSGTGSATQSFRDSEDWRVFDVEIQEKFNPDICKDIREVRPSELPNPDFVWASPPCTDFSLMSASDKWTRSGWPQIKGVSESVEILYYTLYLIQELNPDYWFLENPKGKMRNAMPVKRSGTVTYCQYGDNRMKPTDLWGKHPASFEYRSCKYGSDCHESAKRGDMSGTQGMEGNQERSRIPYGLSESIRKSVENPKGKFQSTLQDVELA